MQCRTCCSESRRASEEWGTASWPLPHLLRPVGSSTALSSALRSTKLSPIFRGGSGAFCGAELGAASRGALRVEGKEEREGAFAPSTPLHPPSISQARRLGQCAGFCIAKHKMLTNFLVSVLCSAVWNLVQRAERLREGRRLSRATQLWCCSKFCIAKHKTLANFLGRFCGLQCRAWCSELRVFEGGFAPLEPLS